MKIGVNLKWKELCKETGHEEWLSISQQKSREARVKILNKQIHVVKSAHTYYMIVDDKPAPIKERFVYQRVKPNQIYGRLTTLEVAKDAGTASTWYCLCECGNMTEVGVYQLLTGKTQSCGCLQRERSWGRELGHTIKLNKEVSFEENPQEFIMVQRKLLTPSLRYKILKRDNFHCKYCGRGAEDGVKLNVDHIFPLSKGGYTTEDNLQTLCWDCNIGKSDSID